MALIAAAFALASLSSFSARDGDLLDAVAPSAPAALTSTWQSSTAGSSRAPADAASANAPHGAASLDIWNRHITDFRAVHSDWEPAERARRASQRILAIPEESGGWRVASRFETLANQRVCMFTVNGEHAFNLFEDDVDRDNGQTLEDAARSAETALREVMQSRVDQRDWSRVLRGVAVAAVVTLLFVLALIAAARASRYVREAMRRRLARMQTKTVVAGVNWWPVLSSLRLVLARVVNGAIYGVLAYVWLAVVLEQFPYTQPWGDALGSFLLRVIGNLAWGVLAAIPNLFVVVIVFALAQALNRGVGSYFIAVERGEMSVSWLTSETARATRQIVALLTWAFAVVIAYPYIPGSQTDAFKGVTVFFGLMISLGSAGLVNQVMSGLTVIYSRAYRRGDFVRIGEQDGRVRHLGLLATAIEKPTGETVAIPNAVVTANSITNYSRTGDGKGEIVSTAVTIGYDAPWRQVHGMLLSAAKNTPDLAEKPEPFVVQRALSDFFVEYQLVVHLAHPERRTLVLSRLHAEIQDAFNASGVQIMSPHFMVQPERPVVVPKTSWFAGDGQNAPKEGTPRMPA